MTLLEKLKKKINECRACDLWEHSHNHIFGEGSEEADIMFVSSHPHRISDRYGIPFADCKARVFRDLIEEAGLDCDDVYFTYLVKCRPTRNRTPLPTQVTSCFPWIKKQIEVVKPEIIFACGNIAINVIFKHFGIEDKSDTVHKIHGKIYEVGNIFIIPTYHTQYSKQTRSSRAILEDIKKVVSDV